MGQDAGEVTVPPGHTEAAQLPASQDPALYDGDKSPQEIQRDIALTRERLGAGLEALETKLSPHEIIRQGADSLRRSFEGTGGEWAERIRANAIPLGLIAAGLAWLLIPRSRRAQEEEAAGPSDMIAAMIEQQETQEAIDALAPPPMVPAGAESSDVEIVQEEVLGDHEREAAAEAFELAAAGDKPSLASAPPSPATEASVPEDRDAEGAGSHKGPP